jgi:hypothetical protein
MLPKSDLSAGAANGRIAPRRRLPGLALRQSLTAPCCFADHCVGYPGWRDCARLDQSTQALDPAEPYEALRVSDSLWYGQDVALDGSTAIVGANDAAYIWARDRSGWWPRQAKLTERRLEASRGAMCAT